MNSKEKCEGCININKSKKKKIKFKQKLFC